MSINIDFKNNWLPHLIGKKFKTLGKAQTYIEKHKLKGVYIFIVGDGIWI